MTPATFTTQTLHPQDQLSAWREWFCPVFDVSPRLEDGAPFVAENKVWDLGGLLISYACAPPTRATRGKLNLARAPVDHWVLTYYRQGATTVRTDRSVLNAPAGVPFLWSLCEPSVSERSGIDRIQLLMPRDMFRDVASLLDASRGSVLDTPLGRLLGDYMVLLEKRLASIAVGDLPHLTDAVRGMVAACIVPSSERIAVAADEIKYGRRERVCQVVRAHLTSSLLGPATLCRIVGISRSQLYRLFEHTGGVARYIQRQRLLRSYTLLSDPANTQSILAIAESLCFDDASGFSRAFKREFGHSPSDIRAAAAAGLPLTPKPQLQEKSKTERFGDLLNAAYR